MLKDFPVILFPTTQDWANWLDANGNAPGLWVRIAKKEKKKWQVLLKCLFKTKKYIHEQKL